mmetsp:Transcript_10860/g.15914  ORF Transcript_10860/g.15914 Transcript_10860/m.15914 type:complete len:418 (+) Transcript_10860:178-1431(+)
MIGIQELQMIVIEQAKRVVKEYEKPVKIKINDMKETMTNSMVIDTIGYFIMVGALMIPLALWMFLPTHTIVYWGVIIGTFVILPLLDLMAPRDKRNLDENQMTQRKENQLYQMLPILFPIIETGMMYWAIDHYVRYVQHLSIIAKIGYYGSIGILTSALGTTIAHELFHKKSTHEKISGIYLLFLNGYSHFYVEHIWGHHKHVGTPHDTASARKYETIYTFIPKSFVGGLCSAYRIEEKRRIKKRLPWHHNKIIQFQTIQLLILWIIHSSFGIQGVIAFVGQAIVSIALVECTNYIEHYGLTRKRVDPKKEVYEQVNVLHSWNATEVLTNYLLFKLQRHSDHHTYPYKRYQTLSSYDVSPQLPTGYPGMICLSFCPPLFFYIMHPLLEKQEERLQHVRSLKINNRTNTLTIHKQPIK